MNTCTKCHDEPKTGRHAWGRKCQSSYQREQRKLYPAKFAAYDRKKHYGMTDQEFWQMAADQNWVCKCCGRPPEGKGFAVDHDHRTGRIRGLLCGKCNAGIGFFNDKPALLRRAAEYCAAVGV